MNILFYCENMNGRLEKGMHEATMQRTGCEIHHSRDAYADHEAAMKHQRQPIGIHHHTFYEIFLFLSGDIDYLVESRLYHMRPGDLLLISPSEMHQPVFVPAKGFYERIVLWVEPEMILQLSHGQEDLAACFHHHNFIRLDQEQKEALQFYMDELAKVQKQPHTYQLLQEQSLLTMIMVLINQASASSSHDPASYTEDYLSHFTDEAVRYIASHLNEPLSLKEISAACHVSPQHLLKVFRSDLGITLHQYIIQKRMLTARQYIDNGMSPTQAAEHCGFDNYTTFWREYRREYGISPAKQKS